MSDISFLDAWASGEVTDEELLVQCFRYKGNVRHLISAEVFDTLEKIAFRELGCLTLDIEEPSINDNGGCNRIAMHILDLQRVMFRAFKAGQEHKDDTSAA